MKNFALIGAAGYIAPRHIRAIKDNGCNLAAAYDPHDSVGVLDSHFDSVDYFREFERFDRHVELLRRKEGQQIDYVSICSPNYMHDAHMRFALRVGADAICEKPLVLNPWNVDALAQTERESGRRINTILQLRLHPSLITLRNEVLSTGKKDYKVSLTYITSRGNWYLYSWKGDREKSGGLSTNIGIHFFDMLQWIFGEPEEITLHHRTPRSESGFIRLERAEVSWFLSIDKSNLPDGGSEGIKTFRSITVDGKEVKFSDGFTDLHTQSYTEILAGRGFGLADVSPSIQTAYVIRNAEAKPDESKMHPSALKAEKK
jgi:UDP-N-acetyl-2-amino-2-deoxyglucuronate dehydrogenase